MTSSSDQIQLSYKRSQLRAALTEAEEMCSMRIDRLLKNHISSALPQPLLNHAITLALESMATAISRAVRAWHEDRGRLCIYFWPGYEKVAQSQARWVMQEKTPPYLQNLLQSPVLSHGIGRYYPTSARGARAESFTRGDWNTEWFNLVLRRSAGLFSEPFKDGAGLTRPPSTHEWFGQQNRSGLPQLMEVYIDRAAKETLPFDAEAASKGRMLVAGLAPNRALHWAEDLRQLSNKYRRIQNSGNARHFPWPAPNMDDKSLKNRQFVKALSIALYDIWLAACFSPDSLSDKNARNKRIDALLAHENLQPDDIARVEALRRYISDGAEAVSGELRDQKHTGNKGYEYTTWYSFPVRSAIWHRVIDGMPNTTPGQMDLGTAMILCNRRIDLDCLEIIVAWIRNMYQGIRSLEVASSNVAEAVTNYSAAFSHELGAFTNLFFEKNSTPITCLTGEDDSPFVLKPEVSETDRKFVESWRISTSPQLSGALRDLLVTWTGGPLKMWGIYSDELSLAVLVSAIAERARAIAAAQRFTIRAVHNWTHALQSKDELERHLRKMPGFKVSFLDPIDVMIDARSAAINNGGGQAQQIRERTTFLARLLMVLLNNSFKHAARDRDVEITIWYAPRDSKRKYKEYAPRKDRDGIFVEISNTLNDAISAEQAVRPDYMIKTSGVAGLCLKALKGSLDAFPTFDPIAAGRPALSTFFLPLKPEDQAESEQAWLKVIQR